MKALKSFGKALGNILKALGTGLWRFMVIFSFIVNIILVVVLAVLLLFLFNIKNDIADPLLKGLHSSFVGLNEATIDWTIPVRDSVDAEFILPLQQNTVVVLTADVPLTVSADISGPVSINNATVALTLPEGLPLPVSLDLQVPVDEEIPVELDVRAVIPLAGTQLTDPFDNLQLLFEPLIIALDNLPNNFGEAWVFGNELIAGQPRDLLDPNTSEYIASPWPGFSTTAGLGYDLLDESRRLNVPGDSPEALISAQSTGEQPPNVVRTGVVPLGGIPALDALIRADLYANDGSPADAIEAARNEMSTYNLPPESYTGGFENLPVDSGVNAQAVDSGTGDAVGGPANSDEALIPGTPQPVFTVMPPNNDG